MFFNLNNENESTETKIYYDYYNTSVHLNQCEKNTLLNGFIKMPFVNSNSVKNPNLRTNKNNYKISKIYFFKNIHHINNLSYDGELIIEHIPITNNVDKIFTVFMLKTGNVPATVLDNIIENAGVKEDVINLNLNEIIIQTNNANKTLNCMNINNVFVFSNPIIVKSTFDQFKNLTRNEVDFLFFENGVYKLNISAIHQKKYVENFQEGAVDPTEITNALKQTTNVTISCTPINTNDIDENVSFVPITSEMNKGYGMVTSLITIIFVFIFMLYPVLEINKKLLEKFSKFEYYFFYISIIIINILISVILLNGNDSISYIIGIIIISLTFVGITLVYFYNQFNQHTFSIKLQIPSITSIIGIIIGFVITLILLYTTIWTGAFGKYTDMNLSGIYAILFLLAFFFTIFGSLLIRFLV